MTSEYSSFKNSKCKITKPSNLSSSPLPRQNFADLLYVERVDREVDSVEVKESKFFTGDVKYETTMEIDCKDTTESIGRRNPTLNTCGLFDDLGK